MKKLITVSDNLPTMFKYIFEIDGEIYKALFSCPEEADKFILDNVRDGSTVTLATVIPYDIYEAMSDEDFPKDYRVDCVADFLFPGYGQFFSQNEIWTLFQRMGLL